MPRARKPGIGTAKPAKQDAAADTSAHMAPTPRDEHAEHLAMMEKLLGEVAGMRAAIVEGFDKLVAHMLDEAVSEAAEPPEPEPPKEDASKAHLAPPSNKVTLDEVREALNAYTRDHGLSEASKVDQSLNVKRLTELPPERYAEAVAALTKG